MSVLAPEAAQRFAVDVVEGAAVLADQRRDEIAGVVVVPLGDGGVVFARQRQVLQRNLGSGRVGHQGPGGGELRLRIRQRQQQTADTRERRLAETGDGLRCEPAVAQAALGQAGQHPLQELTLDADHQHLATRRGLRRQLRQPGDGVGTGLGAEAQVRRLGRHRPQAALDGRQQAALAGMVQDAGNEARETAGEARSGFGGGHGGGCGK